MPPARPVTRSRSEGNRRGSIDGAARRLRLGRHRLRIGNRVWHRLRDRLGNRFPRVLRMRIHNSAPIMPGHCAHYNLRVRPPASWTRGAVTRISSALFFRARSRSRRAPRGGLAGEAALAGALERRRHLRRPTPASCLRGRLRLGGRLDLRRRSLPRVGSLLRHIVPPCHAATRRSHNFNVMDAVPRAKRQNFPGIQSIDVNSGALPASNSRCRAGRDMRRSITTAHGIGAAFESRSLRRLSARRSSSRRGPRSIAST